MNSVEKVLGYTKQVLPTLGWSIKEITSAKYIKPSGRGVVNESYGCYTKPKGTVKGVWVGLVNHRKTEPGIYASLGMCGSAMLLKATRNGYRASPFGPHPMMKKIISERALSRLEKKHTQTQVVRKLKSLLKKTYPFNL